MRVSGGGVQAWQAALASLKARRKSLIPLATLVAAGAVVANVPYFPIYQRGLLTGALLVGALWMLAWVAWVVDGGGFRVNGIWAEDEIVGQLRRHPRTLGVVPSYKIGRRDIDALLVTMAAVYVVEVKWRRRPIDAEELHDMSCLIAKNVRHLRHEPCFQDGSAPIQVRGLLVVVGPGSRFFRTEKRQLGSVGIRLLPEAVLSDWLDGQDRGLITADLAKSLVSDLRGITVLREQALDLPLHLKYLARVRG